MPDVMFETLARLARLAGLKRICKGCLDCSLHGFRNPKGELVPHPQHISSTHCGGSGQVYLCPDEVREPCHGKCLQGRNSQTLVQSHGVHLAICPGWNPSMDLAVWTVAVWKTHKHFTIKSLQHIAWSTYGGLGGFSLALEAALDNS